MGTALSATDFGQIKSRINSLKAQKAELGRHIAKARRLDPESTGSLIEQMKAVSDELKALQKTLKKRLKAVGEESDRTTRWSPELGTIPNAIGDQHVSQFKISDYFSDPSRKSAINKYVAEHPAGSIWHTVETVEFIAKTYGHPSRYLIATDATDGVVGILPLVQLNSRLFGNVIVSTPYFNYGGVLAAHRSIADALLEEAAAWRQQVGADSIELRHVPDSRLGLKQRTDKLTFWLPLPSDSKDLWDSFQPKVRAQIRRGEKEKAEILFGRHELLNDFYAVFSRNMRDLGTPVYGKSFFGNLLDALGSQATLVVAHIDSFPVGCAFITGFGNRMEIPWASTLREYNHTGINMLMYWKVLELSIAKNCNLFDFGRCSKDAGTYRFKQQWGATPVQLNWDYILNDGEELPGLNPQNPKFRFLIAVWKRLPVWMSRVIGPRVVKFLP